MPSSKHEYAPDVSAVLDGLRVVDLSWGLAGAITTMVLADNGADVIKVEPRSGDPQRVEPAFAQWHRGKRSVVLDLKATEARRRVQELADGADVVVTGWRPGVAGRLGLGYEELAARNPGLVYCEITGFGPQGPWKGLKGYEAVVGAKAGIMAYDDRPRYAPIPGASFGASQGALQGVLAALYERGRSGLGQKVEASLIQGLTAYDLYHWLSLQDPVRFRPAIEAPTIYSPIQGMTAFTRDGRWLQLSNFRSQLFKAFLKATELDDWYRQAMAREQPPEVLVRAVLSRLHEKTLDEWMAIFLAEPDIGVEPFRTPTEAMEHEQMVFNGDVIAIDDPVLGPTKQVGPLARMAATPARIGRPSPGLGADTASVGWTARPDRAAGHRSASALAADGVGPLSGLVVIELAWFYAAPFGLALLADLGARVIKVEGPDGDPHRYQSGVPEHAGVKGLQGKESVVVDYRTAEGLEVLHRLVAQADLVMCNYRQTDKARSRDSYEQLVRCNRELVYLYAAAYGSAGPYNTRPAFAPTMSVAAGQRAYQLGWDRALQRTESLDLDDGLARLAQISRWNGGLTQNGDATAAIAVGTAALLGILARNRTGTGQYLETTMICSNAYPVSDEFLQYGGKQPSSSHDENGVNALYRLYPASEGWVFLAAPLVSEWVGLCDALRQATGGRCDLAADARFADADARRRHDADLADAIGRVLATRSAGDWEKRLGAQDVACPEVSQLSLSEFTIRSPAMTANGFVEDVDHPLFGRHLRHGPMVTLSRTPGRGGPGSLPGQHTRQVLGELGYSETEMAALRAMGVIGWPDDR